MSRNKGINKLVVSDDTTPSLQELPVLASETLGVFVHSTNSTVPSKLFLSQGTATQASFSRIEFDTDSGLGIFTDVPFVSSHDASIKFKARGTDYWKIEGVDGSSGDLLPLINNQLKIGRSGFNLAETFSRKITSDSTLALAAGGATKWNLDSGGNLIPSTANSQNFGATSTALSQIFGNQLNSGTGQALYLGSNGGAYQWRIANGTNAAFIPNSTYDIGASASRVGKLWGTDIDITGTINSGGFSSSGDVITNSIRTVGTSDNLVIKTGTGFAEKVRITSEGKVGIGTTFPYANLDVASSLQIGSNFPPSNNFYITATGDSMGALQFWNGNHGTGIELMRITWAGNVGIGTTTPDRPLVINSAANILAAGEPSLMVVGETNKERIACRSYGGDAVFIGQTALGTVASPTSVTSGRALSYLGGAGYHSGNAFSGTVVAIGLSAAENFTPTAQGTQIVFETTPTGSTTRAERMRIDANGNVGIGTSTPSSKLSVTGGIITNTIASGNAGINLVSTGGSGRTWGCFSNNFDGSFTIYDTTGAAERMRISADGKVGIGTNAPLDPLDVVSGASVFRARFRNTTSNDVFALFQNSYTGTGTHDGLSCGINSSGTGYFWNYENQATIFGTSGTEKMRITSDGDVGIGTFSPGTKLDVSGSIRSSSQLISTVATGTAPLSVTSTTKVSNLNADLLDDQTASYYLNYDNLNNKPTIGDGTLTLAVSGTGLSGSASFTANQIGNTTFTVTSNATSANTASTIVARDASGNFSSNTLTLGSVDSSGPTLPFYALGAEVFRAQNPSGDLQFISYAVRDNTNPAGAANVFISATTGRMFRSSSSIRYKMNVEDLDDSHRDAILGLRPVWFRSKKSDPLENPVEWSYYGLIAEEVAEIEPRLVNWEYKQEDLIQNEDGSVTTVEGAERIPGGVNYGTLSVLNLALIQKLVEEVQSLNEEVKKLKERIEILES